MWSGYGSKERSYERTRSATGDRQRLAPGRHVRRRNARTDLAVRATVLSYGDMDGNAHDRPRGRAEHVRQRLVDVHAG